MEYSHARRLLLHRLSQMACPPPAQHGLIAPPRQPRVQLDVPPVPPPPPTGFSGICHAAAKGKVAPPPPPEGFSGVCKTAATPKIAKAAENIAVDPKVPVAKAVKPDALVKHVYFDFDQNDFQSARFQTIGGMGAGRCRTACFV